MDERVEKALKFANLKITQANQRENLRTQLYEKLILGVNGGLFDINQTLISFVSILASKTDSAVILDKNNNPVLIENLNDFLDEILSRYMENTNLFYQDYTALNKARNVKNLMDFNEEKLKKEVSDE
ncbi:MAG: hypothetical protein CO117_12640 [Flavobacteriaceae bacterium CG_4_9_14_3_um_filter_33_16]|nr:MAG: hypothetical protein CO117_12640 [Flavobacteriaceae bacterium CG_4_9_14_3_um_filter_33_16]